MAENSLKIKNLCKRIGGVKIVEQVTAIFFPGKITALVGPNGAGKTTLFHLITSELQPDCGEILYRGKRIDGLPPYRIARNGIGRLFQDVRVFNNLTVFENVASACYDEKMEKPWIPFTANKKLKRLRDEINAHVMDILAFTGLTDELHAPASGLSYGQQKLLAIARLLAGNFSVLLLDEPTAGLSPPMIKKVLGILERIVEKDRKKTIVIVEHNMSVVTQIADWVYFMNEGRIAFSGRTDHVLGDKEVREMYLGL